MKKSDMTIAQAIFAMETLAAFARIIDCDLITDRDANLAFVRRAYDRDGKELVRFTPDPLHFRPLAEWNGMSFDQIREIAC